jgi:hypothetical protein
MVNRFRRSVLFTMSSCRLCSLLIMFSIYLTVGAALSVAVTPEERLQDVDALVTFLETTHPDLYRCTSKTQWHDAAAKLKKALPSMNDYEYFTEIMRYVALACDGHTWVYPPMDSAMLQNSFPVRFAIFADGLFVVAATERYRSLVGRRVVSIDGHPIETVIEKLKAILSGDNTHNRNSTAEKMLSFSGCLYGLGILSNPTDATLRLSGDSGDQDVEIQAVELPVPLDFGRMYPHGPTPPRWSNAHELVGVATPLWMRNMEKAYWFEHLAEKHTIYMQFNAVRDSADERFREFCERMFAYIETHIVDRLVIDLRHSSGGNGYLLQPLIHGLVRSDRIRRPGGLFVLIGREVFSASIMCAAEIESNTNAIFVGEPTPSAPNHSGDATRQSLPGSGAFASCSTLRWQLSDPRDERTEITPDISTPLTFQDFIAGRDPAMEAALGVSAAKAASIASGPPNKNWMRKSK